MAVVVNLRPSSVELASLGTKFASLCPSRSASARTIRMVDKKQLRQRHCWSSRCHNLHLFTTHSLRMLVLCIVVHVICMSVVVNSQQSNGNDVLYFELLENSPPGTIVGQIPTKPGFTYRLSEELGEFFLEPNAGVLIAGDKTTDRESKDFYNLVILSSSPTYPIEVKIKILDVNDNEPFWPPFISRNVSFSESARVGTKLIINTATDLDDDELFYQIVQPAAPARDYGDGHGGHMHADKSDLSFGDEQAALPFRFTYNESSSFLQLEVTDKLDRETESSYFVNISATDRDGFTGYLGLTVRILDVNDNPPIFDHSDYSVSLNESVGKSVSILQVRATDADEEGNQNSAINYYLQSREYFSIDPMSGVISTNHDGPIDCGTPVTSSLYKKVCVFTVFAHDGGSPRQNGRAYVTVNLVDANDHDPQIKFRFFSLSDHVTIDKDAANGSVVAAVSVVDLDHGVNGETSIAIIGGNQFGHFRLESTGSSHIIRVNGSLNREKLPKYNLTISAHDHGQPPRSSTAYLIVVVNHNAPRFTAERYNASILEEVDEPTMVLQLAASDIDLSESENDALLTYSLIEPVEGPFRIDAHYGIIWTTGRVDREQNAHFKLHVSVEDEGGFSSTCLVLVTVVDSNDNPPRFTRLFSANITENAPLGTFVVQVTSSDKDEGSFAEATYSFIGPSEAFEIEPHTGKLFLVNKLDRELKDEYLLMVAANDSSWRAQTTVTIYVLDENDNAPRFEKAKYDFKRAVTSRDTRIGQVRATDADKGVNALIDYSLKEGSQHFVINSQTGELSLRPTALATLVYNNELIFMNQHNLTVVATDRGQIPNLSQVAVIITLLPDAQFDYNQKLKSVRIPIPYDLRNGTVVYNLHSNMSPRPADILPPLLYVMGSKVVFLGEGQVQPAEEYSFKMKPTSGASVAASVATSVPVSANADEFTIVLVIVSPNAFAPKFAQPRSQIIVAESRQTTEPLVQLMAMDQDTDSFNKDITYSYKVVEWKWNERAVEYYSSLLGKEIRSDSKKSQSKDVNVLNDLNKTHEKNILDPFRLDRERGELFLDMKLDYELVVMYRLEVTARDNAWFDSKNSSTLLTVLVEDVNDNKPQFTNLKELQKGMEVFENNPIGHIVGEVHATDFDSAPNSQVTFEIEPVYDHLNFSISAKTGQIQALSSFDYERQSEYVLKVSAKNNNKLKSSVLVKIKVNHIKEFGAHPMSIGVGVVILFFIVLFLVISTSFVLFRSQKKKDHLRPLNNNQRKVATLPLTLSVKHYHPAMAMAGNTANSSSLNSTLMHIHPPLRDQNSLNSQQQPPGMANYQHQHQQQHQHQHQHQTSKRPPDVVDSPPNQQQQHGHGPPILSPPNATQRTPPAPPSFQVQPSSFSPSDIYSEILIAAEHYDLENASSIAPSDIDLVYHYKGYPPRDNSGQQQHRHVPLARLSPSVSELTAPRILTLHDLSPSVHPCPPNMANKVKPPTMVKQSRPPTIMPPDSSDDDDGQNTVDSFTSSEFDETYKLN